MVTHVTIASSRIGREIISKVSWRLIQHLGFNPLSVKTAKISTCRIFSIKRLLELVEPCFNMAKRTEGKFTIRKAFEKDKDDIYRVHTKAIQKICRWCYLHDVQ